MAEGTGTESTFDVADTGFDPAGIAGMVIADPSTTDAASGDDAANEEVIEELLEEIEAEAEAEGDDSDEDEDEDEEDDEDEDEDEDAEDL